MTITPASRLACEHCHGTGYITTALGKLPCLTCSTSEFVSTGQGQSEVSNCQEMSGLKTWLIGEIKQEAVSPNTNNNEGIAS